jgi:hypothetical protein
MLYEKMEQNTMLMKQLEESNAQNKSRDNLANLLSLTTAY